MIRNFHKALDRHTARTDGFTLVELVAALVIVGIIGAVTLPRLFDHQAFSERGYVDEVASSLRYAQRIALASQCEVSVAIDVASYTANQRNALASCNNGALPFTRVVRRSDGSVLSGTAPADVAMAPATTIVFGSTGTVINGNPPVFTAGPFTLTVDAASGNVTVTP